MVEKKDKERKKKKGPKKLKRKQARPTQTISQKVVVNLGKGYGTKRRTGTQAKRSVQPQQVAYQNQPIPLMPDYSAQLNDLRNEVKTHLSGVNKEEGRRRAIELREQHDAQMVRDELARRVAFQEGTQETAVQTERQFEPAQRPETPPPLQATQAPQVGVALGTPVEGQRFTKPEPLGAGGGESSEPLGAGGGEPKKERRKRRTKAQMQASRSKSIEPFVTRGRGAAEEEEKDPSFL